MGAMCVSGQNGWAVADERIFYVATVKYINGANNYAFALYVSDPSLLKKVESNDFGQVCPSSPGRDRDPANLEGSFFSNAVSGNYPLLSSLNLKSGNLYHSQQAGPLTLSYNSLDASSGPLGVGWAHDFDISLRVNASGGLYVKESDGQSIWFGADSSGVFHADLKSGDTSTIVKNQDGSYTRTARYGNVYRFSSAGKLLNLTDRNGNSTTFTYTGSDLTGITDAVGRTITFGVSGGKIVSVTDYAGHTTTIAYDPASGQITSVTDPLSNTWNYQYDSNLRMVQKIDPSGNTTTYGYDPNTGKLSSATAPDGTVRTITYDPTLPVTTVTEPDGGAWITRYDPIFGVPAEETDPLSNKTTYAYDANHRLLSKTYADASSESFNYDANGNATSQTDRAGRITTVTYNAQNRIETITDPAGGVSTIGYDANGNVTSIEDPTGAVTRMERDLSGSLAPVRGTVTAITDPLNHRVQYVYDSFNHISSITGPDGAVTNVAFDISGNLLSRVDPLGHTATFTYDANGNLKTGSATLINDAGSSSELTSSFEYDPNGNVNRVTDPLARITRLVSNFRGQMTQKTDALNATVHFAYGAAGCASCGGGGEKLTSVTDQAGSTTSFLYDKRGLLTTETDPLQKSRSYTYNEAGRLSSKTDRNNLTTTYLYDATGNPTHIDYPDGSTVVNTFDALEHLKTMQDSLGTTSFTYDGAGRVLSATDPDGFTLSYLYDAAGNLTHMTYPDGSIVDYAYDSANRLTGVTFGADQASYTYDVAGRLTSFTHFNGIITSFTYDSANRLTGISSAAASYVFTLDAAGNRTRVESNEPLECSLTAGATDYVYNSSKNRLQSAGGISFIYNDEGELSGAGTTAYQFDSVHRLTGIGNSTTFTYDGAGRRLKAIRSGVETRYIVDPFGNVVAEADATGQITRKYIYGIGLLALETEDSQLFCYHFNGTGHTVALTDLSQNIVNAYSYEPFGEIANEQETIPQPFKFVGKCGVMAEEGGLYFMRARYYDSTTGRFISEDPIGFGGGDTNLLAYVSNNPINWIDPDGLVRIKAGGKIYDYHPNDHHGVNPPEVHVHDIETGNKVGAETGTIYDPKGKTSCGNIGKKNLASLRSAMRALELLGVAVMAYETYDAVTATDAHALENLVDLLQVFPPDRRENVLQDVINRNPDKFIQVNQ